MKHLMTDDVFIEYASGEKSGPYKTNFSTNDIYIFDSTLVVDDGDQVIQPLPNGREVRYKITDSKFNSGIGSIEAHWKLSIIKESKANMQQKKPATTVNISNSNVQVGDGNIQNIVNSFQELTEKIESSDASSVEKQEARGILKNLLKNATVSSILGGATSGLIGLL